VKQEHRICHCGKCKITCNKHGKRAKCADCGKIRLLGTIVQNGIMRHSCAECCDKINKEREQEYERQLKSLFDEIRAGNSDGSFDDASKGQNCLR